MGRVAGLPGMQRACTRHLQLPHAVAETTHKQEGAKTSGANKHGSASAYPITCLQAIAARLNERQANYAADVARVAYLYHADKKGEWDEQHADQRRGGQRTLNSMLRASGQPPPQYPGIAVMEAFTGTWDPHKFGFKVREGVGAGS